MDSTQYMSFNLCPQMTHTQENCTRNVLVGTEAKDWS
jgi:hypothetical protein